MTTQKKDEIGNPESLVPQADASVISRDWSAAGDAIDALESLLQLDMTNADASASAHICDSFQASYDLPLMTSSPVAQATAPQAAASRTPTSAAAAVPRPTSSSNGASASVPPGPASQGTPTAKARVPVSGSAPTGGPVQQTQGSQSTQSGPAVSSAGPEAAGGIPTPTIDWNTLPPDGTDASLERLVSSIGTCFRCGVFLGSVSSSGHLVKLLSTDKVWTTMKKKPLWLKNMMTEASQATRPLGSSPVCGMMTAVMLQANHQLGAKHVFGTGLQLEAGLPKFAVAMAQDGTATDEDAAASIKQLMSLAPALSDWLVCWQRSATGRIWLQRKTRVTETVKAKPKTIIAIVLALAALMWVPLPYWPKRECVLEPTVRQYVASPIAGRVLQAEVRPGDTVRTGQLLAHLDDEQLRWDLSTAQAEYEAAAKKRDTALANKSAGNMRVAQLELEQIAVRIEAIKSNLDRLSVSSPIDGVVLQGEWFRSPGAPINRGDCLFEIAPLERMTVETHLRTEDLGQVQVGNEVTLRVDSASDRTWDGKIGRIDPRAKIVEDKVVFVAEVEVADAAEALRPGMKGSVTISAGPRTVGWLLFNRPYQWLMKKLLW
ncbi:MAG: efflux RND transporter periplasmic adaptor subunit [Pirellulales bacterium]